MSRVVIKLVVAMLLLAASAVHFTCTRDIAGAGSETTNGIAGVVCNGNGTLSESSIVKLLPTDFNTTGRDTVAAEWIDTTDAKGRYFFAGVKSGSYNVIMRNPERTSCCLLDSISYSDDDSLLELSSATLKATGTVRIVLDGQIDTGVNVVYIPGTDMSVSTDDSLAVIDGVPVGQVSSVFVLSDDKMPVEIRSSVQVGEGETVTITNPSWHHAGVVELNTTDSGCLLQTPLYNFAVHLKLSDSNFMFGEARPDGGDIRLTKSDDSPVPFEIARWDRAGRQADIWIAIDTLHPDTVIELNMYWGNEQGTSHSSPGQVFDTSYGFQGVWHFEPGRGDTLTDATLNGYDGVVKDGPLSFSDGAAGQGCLFDGNGGHILMPGTADSRLSFPQNSGYTVSAWVYIAQTDGESHVVLSKGNYHYFIFYTSIHTDDPVWEFSEYQSNEGWDLSAGRAESGGWHMVTGVRDGESQLLYYDGVLVDSTGFTYKITAPSDMTYDLVIGRFLQDFGGNDYCFFDGAIDEVVIADTVRSRDWIRVNYENMRSDNKLVRITHP